MRPGFEESAEGNNTLDEAKAGAPPYRKGADISEEDENILCDIMDQLYYKEPLMKLQHPHPLSKRQLIEEVNTGESWTTKYRCMV